MLVDDIKKRVASAVKEGDTAARDVLRLSLGEIQTAENRKNSPLSDDEVAGILRKLIKSNEETLGLSTGDAAKTLAHEIEVLRGLLPPELTVAQIVERLAAAVPAIRAAKAEGQAIGAAVKELKGAGITAPGNVVAAAVKEIRAQS